MVTARIVGTGEALPPAMDHAQLWSDFFSRHYGNNSTAARVWTTSGIRTRPGVIDPRVEDVSGWPTSARMTRYAAEAAPLGKEAVATALADAGVAAADAGVAAADVGLFTVVSCTGYGTPGLDIGLARDLGMPDDVQRLMVGHMGCYAAIPGLGAVSDFVVARNRPAVLLCVELTSLHLQPATDEVQQMVAHALFADAAAAVVVAPGMTSGTATGSGLEVIDVVARTDAATSDHMTWDVTDLGFRMGLSPQVPDVLARHARPVVESLLAPHGLRPEQVAGWAVHPGGRRILEVVAEQLRLGEDALEPAYRVLRDCGNCSSATVLLVLRRLIAGQDLAAGSHLVAMAFGPGLTLYAALLRVADAGR